MVKVEGLEKLLAQHPFFEDMSEDQRKTLAGCARNERFAANTVIAHEGDPAQRFYFLRSGAVALELHTPTHDPIIVETLGDGDVFGWSWLVPPHRWTYDVRALQLTRLISLDGTCLRKKLKKDHDLGYQLYRRFVPVMARRLAHTRLQLIDMYGKS